MKLLWVIGWFFYLLKLDLPLFFLGFLFFYCVTFSFLLIFIWLFDFVPVNFPNRLLMLNKLYLLLSLPLLNPINLPNNPLNQINLTLPPNNQNPNNSRTKNQNRNNSKNMELTRLFLNFDIYYCLCETRLVIFMWCSVLYFTAELF